MEFKVQCICPIPDKLYGGDLIIEYVPYANDLLIEWNSFQEWLSTLQDLEFTAEGLVSYVRSVLDTVPVSAAVIDLQIDTPFHLPVQVHAEL